MTPSEKRLNQMHGRPYGWRGITLEWVKRSSSRLRPEWVFESISLKWLDGECVFLAKLNCSYATHADPAKALALARSKAVSELAKFSELIQSTE